MKNIKIIGIIICGLVILNAQNIEAKLGGSTSNDVFEILDSDNDLLFRIQGDGGLLFNGKNDLGSIPIEGAGVRMMFYDGKGAFRAGWVNGTQWDDSNIGVTSFAVGQHTTASGKSSSAIGESTTASGNQSTAIGYGTKASGASSVAIGEDSWAKGDQSTAMGFYTTASGKSSTAMGVETQATGIASTAMGDNTIASGHYSTALGREIQASGESSIAIALNNQNGTNVTQANTMAIMGGKVGIGTPTPDETLEVNGSFKTNSLKIETGASDGYVLKSDANGNAIWGAVANLLSGKIYTVSQIVSLPVSGTVKQTIIECNDNNDLVLSGGYALDAGFLKVWIFQPWNSNSFNIGILNESTTTPTTATVYCRCLEVD